MKTLFDHVSEQCSQLVTKAYSTSFSTATALLAPSVRSHIFNIYGFVRFADEIVDSFHDYDKEQLFKNFERDLAEALEHRISLNPILNSFQHTYHTFNIDYDLVAAFMKSMRMDLTKSTYKSVEEYKEYIYGSADVVGLMCLTVFVDGDKEKYTSLKESAMALGSAFQKVNFLRDLKADFESLGRTYFPNANLEALDEVSKQAIIDEIEADFNLGFEGIQQLPATVRLGVYTAYRYYKRLLDRLKNTPPLEIKNSRIRVPNYEKLGLVAQSYFEIKFQRV
ncbi:MAG: phytoene/squalene synthase family protein [Flavobacteriaceae bacterium]|jgi:phytoene synthase